jgi:hypothetical protein
MPQWLDTQTKAILQNADPPKCAPPLAAEYSLVLLEKGQWPELHRRALCRILGPEKAEITPELLGRACPYVIESSLTYASSSLGQFELICGNSISVILRDEVALDGECDYLRSLFQSLRQSPEFQIVTLTLLHLPEDERGKDFGDQFLGGENALLPVVVAATRKKARIMEHWARKIGARVELGFEP